MDRKLPNQPGRRFSTWMALAAVGCVIYLVVSHQTEGRIAFEREVRKAAKIRIEAGEDFESFRRRRLDAVQSFGFRGLRVLQGEAGRGDPKAISEKAERVPLIGDWLGRQLRGPRNASWMRFQREALELLVEMGENSRRTQRAVLRASRSGDERARRLAAYALGMLWNDSRTKGALETLSVDLEPTVAAYARCSMWWAFPSEENFAKATKLIRSGQTSYMTLGWLESVGAQAHALMPALRDNLESAPMDYRWFRAVVVYSKLSGDMEFVHAALHRLDSALATRSEAIPIFPGDLFRAAEETWGPESHDLIFRILERWLEREESPVAKASFAKAIEAIRVRLNNRCAE